MKEPADFPSFSEGLSLRAGERIVWPGGSSGFPFLFGGTFIEGYVGMYARACVRIFPFLFGGTFIEGPSPA